MSHRSEVLCNHFTIVTPLAARLLYPICHYSIGKPTSDPRGKPFPDYSDIYYSEQAVILNAATSILTMLSNMVFQTQDMAHT